MPALDIFNSNAFSLVSLTDSIKAAETAQEDLKGGAVPSFEKCLITASRTVKLWNFVAKEDILSVPVYAHHATSVDIWSAPQSVSATLVVGNVEGVIITWSLEITPIGVKVLTVVPLAAECNDLLCALIVY